jgi:hypothetical protein
MAPEYQPTEPNPAHEALMKLLERNPAGSPIFTDEEILEILHGLGFTSPISPFIPVQVFENNGILVDGQFISMGDQLNRIINSPPRVIHRAPTSLLKKK